MPILLGTLAAAYAEAGRFPEALANRRQSARPRARRKPERCCGQNQQLLELYQSGHAFHETRPQANGTTDRPIPILA